MWKKTIANIICLVLFLAAIIPPWRLIGFCLSRDSHEAFEDMNYFRECALRNFCITLMDMFGLPFYLIGIVQPTRFDISICAIAAACTPAKYRSEYPNTSVRALLVYNACFGFIDLIGIAAFVCVFFVPWPTDVFKQLRHEYNTYLINRKSYLKHTEHSKHNYPLADHNMFENFTTRQHFKFKCALICVGIFIRTIFESGDQGLGYYLLEKTTSTTTNAATTTTTTTTTTPVPIKLTVPSSRFKASACVYVICSYLCQK